MPTTTTDPIAPYMLLPPGFEAQAANLSAEARREAAHVLVDRIYADLNLSWDEPPKLWRQVADRRWVWLVLFLNDLPVPNPVDFQKKALWTEAGLSSLEVGSEQLRRFMWVLADNSHAA